MNRDEVIRIARRYGTPVQEQNGEIDYLFNVDMLIALLLAEQEACADICDAEASIEGIAQRCAANIRKRGEG